MFLCAGLGTLAALNIGLGLVPRAHCYALLNIQRSARYVLRFVAMAALADIPWQR